MPGMIQLPKESLPFLQKIFGPAAEVGELISEKIRYFRWKSSLKTMQRAEELAAKYGINPTAVPYKTLVPLIEKASLEDEDSPLIEKWANLLASASMGSAGRQPAFVEILSALTFEEVRLLEGIIPSNFKETVIGSFQMDGQFDLSDPKIFGRALLTLQSAKRAAFLGELSDRVMAVEQGSPEAAERAVTDVIFKFVDHEDCGILIEFVEFDGTKDGQDLSAFSHSELFGNDSAAFDVMLSKGLLHRHVSHAQTAHGRLVLSVLHPTPLAVAFVSACRGDDLDASGGSSK